jgi:hypothetical protein
MVLLTLPLLHSSQHQTAPERRCGATSMYCTTSYILRRRDVEASYTARLQCF